jgi:hypothetical protein
MPGMGKSLQRDGDTIRLQFLSQSFCLLYRNAFILRTVQQKNWNLHLVGMIDGRPSSKGVSGGLHIPRMSATQSMGRLPLSPREACHPIHTIPATQST